MNEKNHAGNGEYARCQIAWQAGMIETAFRL